MKAGHAHPSDTFEIIEWLEAALAAPLSLARRRSELAQPFDLLALASRAVLRTACRLGRCDPVSLQLLAPLLRQPVGCPWRADLALELQVLDPALAQCLLYFEIDDAGRGTARVGRRDNNLQGLPSPRHVPDDSEIDETDRRNFRIRHLIE